ncbi:MAG TPA: hypothetical protein VK919_07795 [Solirubrobacterales bacterium]|nr:hypothetical protein [Solirubrobacterales bacterium]
MTRAPDDEEERPGKGGRAAERLRQFLAARFGSEAPPVPPDEEEQVEEEPPSAAAEERSEDEAHQEPPERGTGREP